MIRINNREFEWEQGLTIESLLTNLKATGKYDFILSSNITVIINKYVIQPEEYQNRSIYDGDEIRLYPHIVGG